MNNPLTNKELMERLQAPFPIEDIEFRVQRFFDGNKKALILTYITARAVFQRLDEVFGVGGWQTAVQYIATRNEEGFLLKLSVKCGDEWISKVDIAPLTGIEALKGGVSDAIKRVFVQLGGGRYLYKLPATKVSTFTNIDAAKAAAKGKRVRHEEKSGLFWIEPDMPSWALPNAGLMAKQSKTNNVDADESDIY